MVNPCRPGYGASCSFCCGSHNFTLSPEEIERIFITRGSFRNLSAAQHPEQCCEVKLVKEGMQCPNISMSESDPSILCCHTYTDTNRSRELESFFKGTCRHFQCTAFNNLTDREVLFAARLMGDWYFYSLLINDVETLSDLYATYGNPADIPPDVLLDIKAELKLKLFEDDMI
jgi:hypothetical protein